MHLAADKSIILFDGICNLCNSSVRLVLRNDTKEEFLFSSIQSDASQKLLLQLDHKNNDLKSILLVENGKIFEKSEAVIKIAARLRFPWNMAKVFVLIPVKWRDRIYDYVAANRYRWFGKKDSCVYHMNKYENRFIR
jgi:predicted DCC family thiol-disulfide oxidoreductase YuxK